MDFKERRGHYEKLSIMWLINGNEPSYCTKRAASYEVRQMH